MRPTYDLLCLSHLRWHFVQQRPQHLLNRCARGRRVFFVEEPVRAEGPPRLAISERAGGVKVCVPTLPHDASGANAERLPSAMLRELLRSVIVREHVAWFSTPMALALTGALRPVATVYDCMDELRARSLPANRRVGHAPSAFEKMAGAAGYMPCYHESRSHGDPNERA